jgi:hypothetical protein
MKPDILKLFEDIRLSIHFIEQHIKSVDSLEAYANDQKNNRFCRAKVSYHW